MLAWKTGDARSRLRNLGLGLTLLVVGWLGTSLLVVHALTQRFHREPRAPLVPEGCALREVETRSADGLRLTGWTFEVPEPSGVVLALHGSGDSRRVWATLLEPLAEQHLAALLPDLRAHGTSEGARNDFGWSARRDVLAWTAWLDEHHPDLPRLVVGTSMGAAAALFAAAEADLGADALGLDACYRDLDTAQRHRLQGRLPEPLAWLAALGMRATAPLVFEFDVEASTPLAAAQALAARGHPPVLVTGALGDPWAQPWEQRELAAALGPPTELAFFGGGGHLAGPTRDPWGYVARLVALLED